MNDVAKKEKTDVAVVDWRQGAAELAEQTASVDATPTNTIQCMDAEFVLGEDTFTEFQAIILDSAHVHALYTSGYDPDDPEPPACFAVDLARDDTEMKPVSNCPSPAAENCDACENNKFGTADNGKGKACNQRRRLLLLAVENVQDLTPDKVEKSDVAVMAVPTTSIKTYRAYAKHLRKVDHVMPFQVVTGFKIVKDKKTRHRVEFEPIAQLEDDDLLNAIWACRGNNLTELLREPDFTGYGETDAAEEEIGGKV